MKKWKVFVSGFLAAFLLIGMVGTAVATVGSKTVNIEYNNIKVTMNGKQVNLVDANGNPAEPFAIDGTTYLPIRAVSSALGLEVGWDNDTKTVILETSGDKENHDGSYGAINGKYYNLSVVDVKWTDKLESSLYTVTPKEDGTKLLCLIFSCKNTTDDLKNLGGLRAYADGKAVLPTSILGKIDDAVAFVGSIHGGMEMRTYSIWELPENCETFQLYYYEADGSEDNQNVVIHLKDF